MAMLFALAGTGVALFGALNYIAPLDPPTAFDDEPRLADPAVGLVPARPSEAADIWPAAAGTGIHVRNARPAKDGKGAHPVNRWNSRLPHSAVLPKREVGLLPPGKRMSTQSAQAAQDRIAWVTAQTLPQLLRPTSLSKNTTAPPALRFAHPVA